MRRGLLTFVLLLAIGAVAVADERILDWQSDIRVRPDSTLEVTETLRVRAEGQQIRRGLLRDFPTRYVDRRGQRVVTGFEVITVLRDGRTAQPHQYRAEHGACHNLHSNSSPRACFYGLEPRRGERNIHRSHVAMPARAM
jgi:hypothetical protein